MGTQAVGAFTPATLGVLLSPLSKAQAIGRLAWSVTKPSCHEGVLKVRTAVGGAEVASLRIYYTDHTPSEPTLQYLAGGVAAVRACANTKHDGWAPMTHVHYYVPQTGGERCDQAPGLFNLPLAPTVAADAHRQAFEVFAGLVSVDLPDGYWAEPGGGT